MPFTHCVFARLTTEAEDALEMARYTGVPGPRGKVSAGAMKAATGATQGLLGEGLLRVSMRRGLCVF
jgi:hypothetical protein